MKFANKDFLLEFGWSEFFESQITMEIGSREIVGRIVGEERGQFRTQINFDTVVVTGVRGKLHYTATGREDYPAVGDFVLLEIVDQHLCMVKSILSRKSQITRKTAGETQDLQILATNVDYMLITSSMNDDLSLNRIDRYVTLAYNSNVKPVVVLTKMDVCENPNDVIEQVRGRFPDIPVIAVSIYNQASLIELHTYFEKGVTSVLVGSSGVGKSTLSNYLIGESRLKTQSSRDSDDKGRHTTTGRYLIESQLGGLVIDTPGMRELQLYGYAEGLSTHFEDVEDIILNCRFTDCQHESEPGCKVKQSLTNGSLSEDRWRSYLKLKSDEFYLAKKSNKSLQVEEKKKWKKISKDVHAKMKLQGKK